MTSGFFRLEKSKPLSYTYTYDEMKIIVEGEMHISDETGNTVKAVQGDVLFFLRKAAESRLIRRITESVFLRPA